MWTLLTTALAPLVWGSTYFVTTQFLPGWSPLWVAALRALPVGILLLLWTRQKLPRAWWLRTFLLSLLSLALFWALLFVSVYRLPGGVAATVGAINPLTVAVLAAALLGERLRSRTLLAAFIGIVGVTMVVLGPSARLDGWGILAAVGGNLSSALGGVLTRRWGQPLGLSLGAFVGWQLTIAGAILLVIAVTLGGHLPRLEVRNLGALSYLGLLGAGLTMTLWVRGLQRLPASRVAILGLLSPLAALSLDVLVLHRVLAPVQVLGAALVLAGIVLEQIPGIAIRFGRRGQPKFSEVAVRGSRP